MEEEEIGLSSGKPNCISGCIFTLSLIQRWQIKEAVCLNFSTATGVRQGQGGSSSWDSFTAVFTPVRTKKPIGCLEQGINRQRGRRMLHPFGITSFLVTLRCVTLRIVSIAFLSRGPYVRTYVHPSIHTYIYYIHTLMYLARVYTCMHSYRTIHKYRFFLCLLIQRVQGNAQNVRLALHAHFVNGLDRWQTSHFLTEKLVKRFEITYNFPYLVCVIWFDNPRFDKGIVKWTYEI